MWAGLTREQGYQVLEVTEATVRGAVVEVAPYVEQLTGWNVQWEDASYRVIPKDLAFEEIALGRLQRLGVSVHEAGLQGLLGRLMEYVLEAVVLAAYDPSNGTLYIVRENVDESNWEGLKVVLGHELVHRGQSLYHPELFRELDDGIRQLASDQQSWGELWERVQRLNAIMTVIEGHASYVDHRLRELYPSAEVEQHFNLPVILFRLVGVMKVRQYEEGRRLVTQQIERGELESLYRDLS